MTFSWFQTPSAKMLSLGFLVLLTACQTSGNINSDTTGLPVLDSALRHETSDRFFTLMPNCVAVMPGNEPILSRALARYLSEKFDRVVGPQQTGKLLSDRVLTMNDMGHRRQMADLTRCHSFLDVKPAGAESVFLLSFSMERMGATATLSDIDGMPLWQAGFVTARSEGGFSLDPVGILANTASAAWQHQDQGKFASMADDIARQLASTLPDMKTAL